MLDLEPAGMGNRAPLRVLSVPLVASFYGDDLNGTSSETGRTSLKSQVGVLVSNWLAVRSRRCIVVSDQMRERFWWATLRHKTTVVRDAVDPNLFVARSRSEARARLGLEGDRLLVLFPHRADDQTRCRGTTLPQMPSWSPR